jgi:hypothetical protein
MEALRFEVNGRHPAADGGVGALLLDQGASGSYRTLTCNPVTEECHGPLGRIELRLHPVRQSAPAESEHDLVGRLRKQGSLVIQVVQAQAPRPGFQEHTRFLFCPTQTVRKTREPAAPCLRLSSVRQHSLGPSVAVLWLRLQVNCKINIAHLQLTGKVATENDNLRDSVQEGWFGVDVANAVQELS